MKKKLHPELHDITITCACGCAYPTRSSMPSSFSIEICSGCHPFFTGKQKFIDTAGKIDKFRKKYAQFEAKKANA